MEFRLWTRSPNISGTASEKAKRCRLCLNIGTGLRDPAPEHQEFVVSRSNVQFSSSPVVAGEEEREAISLTAAAIP